MVTWGINPGQAIEISDPVPSPDSFETRSDRDAAEQALEHMDLEPGQSMLGYDVDVAFLGTCTNGRVRDFERAAEVLEGHTVADDVRALAVPGSETTRRECEARGIDEVFIEAGFQWRQAGCSMCLAMNNDSLDEDEVSASSSNRNFIGRQGSKQGRTVLMSPVMVAAAAVEGEVTDARRFLNDQTDGLAADDVSEVAD
jgi:3-isopropylmalate/(R)-2-methylmalate dehydratase large subunit